MQIFLDSNVVVKEFENQGILINTNLALYKKLNRTGLYIAQFLQDNPGSSMEKIVESVSNEYAIPIKLLKEDIENFVLGLITEEFFHSSDKEIAFPKHDVLDYDGTIWIQVTNKCNLCCDYCYASAGDSKDDLTIDEIEIILSALQERGFTKIAVTGGEALTRKDIIKVLDVCVKYGKVMLLTNGTIGNRDLFSEIIKRIDSIQISLDSSTSEIHDKNRGKGTYDRVISTISMLAEIAPQKVVIAMTPTPDFNESLENMIKFCLKYNIRNLHINKLISIGRAKESYCELLDISKLFAWADTGYQFLNKLYIDSQKENDNFYFNLDVASDLRTSIYTKSRKISCGLNFNLVSVAYNGNVYLCPSLHMEQLKLGNIREESILLIIDKARKKYGDFHTENLSKCKNCYIKYYCGGGCRALAQIYNNDIYGEDIYCKDYQKRLYSLMLGNT